MPATPPPPAPPVVPPANTWRRTFLWSALAIAAFHAAYLVPPLAFLMLLFLYALIQLSFAPTARSAFYSALLVGLACYAPHLWFFLGIFGPVALALWSLLALWIGFFVLLAYGLRQIPGIRRWAFAAALPILWMGLEYFRCELYYLKFAWLTPGIAMCNSGITVGYVYKFGVYGAGFILMAVAAMLSVPMWRRKSGVVGIAILLVMATVALLPSWGGSAPVPKRFVAIQLESPSETQILDALDTAVARYPDAVLFAMSEYTLASPPTERICAWCRSHQRHVLLGGIYPLDPAPDGKEQWADTAFVIGPNGDIVFTQGKCVPIQFFDDGQPATEQNVWNSPWGKIGICICYDLSYTRVTDELVRQGAQMLIVPTLDAISWGEYEHRLHAFIGNARGAEYHIPVLRIRSSGAEESIADDGTATRIPYPGQGAIVSCKPMIFHRAGRLPPDRLLAPVCVALTAVITLALIIRTMIRKWRHKSTPQGSTN